MTVGVLSAEVMETPKSAFWWIIQSEHLATCCSIWPPSIFYNPIFLWFVNRKHTDFPQIHAEPYWGAALEIQQVLKQLNWASLGVFNI